MRLQNLLDDGKSQACPMFPSARPGKIGLVKPVEYIRQSLGRYPFTRICNFHLNTASGFGSPESDGTSGRREFQGIIDQVGEDLCQAVSVASNQWEVGGFQSNFYIA
jgi:hypothetical protein